MAHGLGILNVVVSKPELACQRLNENGMSAALRLGVISRWPIARAGWMNCSKPGRGRRQFHQCLWPRGHEGDAFFALMFRIYPRARSKIEQVGLEIIADAKAFTAFDTAR